MVEVDRIAFVVVNSFNTRKLKNPSGGFRGETQWNFCSFLSPSLFLPIQI